MTSMRRDASSILLNIAAKVSDYYLSNGVFINCGLMIDESQLSELVFETGTSILCKSNCNYNLQIATWRQNRDSPSSGTTKSRTSSDLSHIKIKMKIEDIWS
jgi:hypothetical protein